MLHYLILLALIHPALQAPVDEDPLQHFNHHVREEAKRLFVAFDYNLDGDFDHIDLQMFLHAYDVDNNGTIEREEFEVNFDMQEPTLAIVAKGLFIEFDSDKSDHVTMQDLEALYNRMDLNKDGNVSHKEFEEYMTEVLTILVMLQLQAEEFYGSTTTLPDMSTS